MLALSLRWFVRIVFSERPQKIGRFMLGLGGALEL